MTKRNFWMETALAGAVAGVLAATPAAAADKSAEAVKVDEMTTLEKVTRSEADAKAHAGADPQELYDPSVSKNVDRNDDGDLIAEEDFDPAHSRDDVAADADMNDDGDLIAEDDGAEAGSQTAEDDLDVDTPGSLIAE